MPLIRKPPQPPEKVFAIATPAAMLWKFAWELRGLRRALAKPAQKVADTHAPAYWAFNCSVTAWHLTDWIWNNITPGERSKILTSLGERGAGKDEEKNFRTFQRALMRKFRVLHVCRQIATGSKHSEVARFSDPSVRAEMRWEMEAAKAGKVRAGDPLATYRYQLVVRDGESERPAFDVFKDAFAVWQRVLEEWGFVEDRFIDGSS